MQIYLHAVFTFPLSPPFAQIFAIGFKQSHLDVDGKKMDTK